MPPAIGIDSIEIVWREASDETQLILRCAGDRDVAMKCDIDAELALAQYALDPNHWAADEHAPWQNVVVLR